MGQQLLQHMVNIGIKMANVIGMTGPAIIKSNGDQVWYKDGKRTIVKMDQAVIYSDGQEHYWLK